MKKLGRLYCHTPCIMKYSNNKTTTVGRFYDIITITDDNRYVILDDNGDDHHFPILIEEGNYKKWFYREEELRKEKLKRLNKRNEETHM